MPKRLFQPLLCLLALAGCDIGHQPPKLNAITVIATGENFNWHFQYPGEDGVLGTADDQYSEQNLLLPAEASVTLKLYSNDYLYSFALPDIALKEIAVPGLDFELSFETGSAQTMILLGDQFCGFSHDSLKGKVRILDQENGFYQWFDRPMTGEDLRTRRTSQTKIL